MSIEELKKKSIIDVAANLGIPLRKIGSTLYEREDHDSFKIFADTNTFKWFSRDIQGDVINLVQLEKDISLTEAMYYLQHGKFKAVEVAEVTVRTVTFNRLNSLNCSLPAIGRLFTIFLKKWFKTIDKYIVIDYNEVIKKSNVLRFMDEEDMTNDDG